MELNNKEEEKKRAKSLEAPLERDEKAGVYQWQQQIYMNVAINAFGSGESLRT